MTKRHHDHYLAPARILISPFIGLDKRRTVSAVLFSHNFSTWVASPAHARVSFATPKWPTGPTLLNSIATTFGGLIQVNGTQSKTCCQLRDKPFRKGKLTNSVAARPGTARPGPEPAAGLPVGIAVSFLFFDLAVVLRRTKRLVRTARAVVALLFILSLAGSRAFTRR